MHGFIKMPRKSAQSSIPTRAASDDILVAKAEALARDPTFREFFDRCQQQHLSDLEAIALDGSEKGNQDALSALYRWQALMDLKRTIYEPLATRRQKQLKQQDD